MPLDVAVDGADECDPNLDLIKGYGRALVREKIVAAAAKKLRHPRRPAASDVKNVPVLGTKGKLPVEVVPFALPLAAPTTARPRLRTRPVDEGRQGRRDRQRQPHPRLRHQADPGRRPHFDTQASVASPASSDTGLFLGMADVVLSGTRSSTW